MRFDVVSLFPEMIRAACEPGITGRALSRGLVALSTWNPRDYTHDVHRTVDDRPYGGGPGMLMLAGPLEAAIRDAKAVADPETKVAYLSPQGRRLDQDAVRELATRPGMILVCGRYEGIDERVIETLVDEEWSLGDYVLSGGELGALVIIDAITRMLPGSLGAADSAEQDSFMDGLLDCPHYTRPEVYEGHAVPEVLRGGNHEAIRRWRLQQALGRTWLRRPELLAARELSDEERGLLEGFQREYAATIPVD
ncbi:MAG: tRNA (guanosine(37)-N1)-methyltransferase TrmD [Gammaproteobacteria bacterium]|nr:tRNA (guanosine(37)-N1)-methyltransferase TrmD [Gammaproteobacteria bacterium]MCP5135616.1 tRNA (guanosine(37)-N1)-methyltransferase TrmD [Gammaproteobacteria bacterium]